ncbi:helix-turn-helix transcriptional regulator [Pseudoduganella danionis]|nr:AlpA family phage regulatory protein [Pseudoduganella danionis]
MSPNSTRLLTRNEVLTKTSFSKSTMHIRMKSDGFPKPIKLGLTGKAPAASTAARWIEGEVDSWIDLKIKEGREDWKYHEALEVDKHPDQRTANCLQTLTLPIFGPVAAIRETRKLMVHLHQNKTLLETLMMRRTLEEDEFLYHESRRVIDELSALVNSATIAFRLGVSEEDIAGFDSMGDNEKEISRRIANRVGGEATEIAERIRANKEKVTA